MLQGRKDQTFARVQPTLVNQNAQSSYSRERKRNTFRFYQIVVFCASYKFAYSDQGCSGKTQPRKTHPVLTGLTHPEKPGDVGFTGFFLILNRSSDDF